MPPTFRTSALFSRYSPSTVLLPSLRYTQTSGRAMPVGLAHPRGRSSTWVLTFTRSRSAAPRGYAACAVADTRRPSGVCGRVGTRNSQPQQWRASPFPPLPRLSLAHGDPVVQDMLLGWRHVCTEAPRWRWRSDSAFPAGRVFGHVGSCRACRRRP